MEKEQNMYKIGVNFSAFLKMEKEIRVHSDKILKNQRFNSKRDKN